jgi:hypothetical protein
MSARSFNCLLSVLAYHCILLTPYHGLTLQSNSPFTGQKSFATSKEISPISCKLLQNVARFVYLPWLHSKHYAFSNSFFDVRKPSGIGRGRYLNRRFVMGVCRGQRSTQAGVVLRRVNGAAHSFGEPPSNHT